MNEMAHSLEGNRNPHETSEIPTLVGYINRIAQNLRDLGMPISPEERRGRREDVERFAFLALTLPQGEFDSHLPSAFEALEENGLSSFIPDVQRALKKMSKRLASQDKNG